MKTVPRNRRSPALSGGTLARCWLAPDMSPARWRERLRLERRPQASGSLAAMHVRAGNLDEAIRVLERGYAERDPTVFSTSNHPQWDPIRSDARFQALCRRAGLTEETNAKLVVSRPSLRAVN